MADSDFDILYSQNGAMYNMKRDPNNPIEPSPFAYYGKRWLVFGMMILVCGAFGLLYVRSKKPPTTINPLHTIEILAVRKLESGIEKRNKRKIQKKINDAQKQSIIYNCAVLNKHSYRFQLLSLHKEQKGVHIQFGRPVVCVI